MKGEQTNTIFDMTYGAIDSAGITTIDVGPTHKNLLEVIREMLPKEKRHLVVSQIMSPKRNYAVNVFDFKQ